ncbi:MAG: chromosome segregation SMC family protein, partial [Rhizomicrobium sp.]
MKFTRLRLSGFKSFVEPTELHVEPGLTAVVGPNGCGKSNLFDALRWVMGETRPTSVRGREMDDVIFSGSAARPARNMAEVTLFIDNTDRTANGAFNEYDSIEISRRIEREAGSVYRINGRDVRQRDVQLFFADASSGAGSTAFVRQGQIGLLISQKPLARRAILEEAAGIGGLHQRRHEAELRLRAAETNLGRLDDVIREVESQVASLKRQARQASRYRNLSGHIRKAEALAHHLRWTAAELRMRAAEEELTSAAALVETCTGRAAEASTAQANAANELPPLRQIEAERSAALHRLVVEREALDAEEARARETAQRLRQRISQTEQDIARDRVLDNDAGMALDVLSGEADSLEAAIARSGEELDEAETSAAALNEALAEAERNLERLTSELAEWHARKSSQERSRELASALADTSGQQLGEAQARLDRAMQAAAQAPDVRAAEEAADTARALAETARNAAAAARATLVEAERAEAESRGPLENAEREWQRLSAEAKALGDLLRPEGQDLFPPLIDAVAVRPGYEAALAAALGDDLQAPLDEASPHHWRDLGEFNESTPLPSGAKRLGEFVEAPGALSRRLAMTGVVFPDQGKALPGALKPGQRLVSPRGDLWRWDGYSASADAPSAAAIRLSQRNRLASLDGEIEVAREARAKIFAIYSAAREAATAARDATRAAEQEERNTDQALIAAQDNSTKAARAAAERASQLASLEAEIRRLAQSQETALESRRQAEAELATLGDGVTLNQDGASARARMAEARTAYSEARATLDGLKREGESRARRLVSIADERTRWEERRNAAASHVEELERRREELTGELTTAESVPELIVTKRNSLLDAISTADAARSQAADARATAEAVLADADKVAKAADAALSAAREDRARAQ